MIRAVDLNVQGGRDKTSACFAGQRMWRKLYIRIDVHRRFGETRHSFSFAETPKYNLGRRFSPVDNEASHHCHRGLRCRCWICLSHPSGHGFCESKILLVETWMKDANANMPCLQANEVRADVDQVSVKVNL